MNTQIETTYSDTKRNMELLEDYSMIFLGDYDVILISSSGGKDSQAQLDVIVNLADSQGVSRDRLIVVHADLGRVEWKGTAELAERQAKHYGLRFEKVSRREDLLTQIEKRGMFPDSARRYCTSDHKRDQVGKLITRLHRESGKADFRLLSCMGIRSDESKAREKKVPFKKDNRSSTQSRHVDIWFPIFKWTVKDVWARIEASGVEHHEAYDLGMSRLSCVFCVFAKKCDLQIAAKANPELLDEYIRVEEKIGHDFKRGFKIAELR